MSYSTFSVRLFSDFNFESIELSSDREIYIDLINKSWLSYPIASLIFFSSPSFP